MQKILNSTSNEKPVRRTQAQRSQEMRERLIEAAITVLEHDGYSAASVNRVVDVAGVSKGAYLHHFPTKHQLIVAVGDALLYEKYRSAGDLMLSVHEANNRFAHVVRYLWRDISTSRYGQVLLELLQACRADKNLVDALRPLIERYEPLFQHAFSHYFEPVDGRIEALHEVNRIVTWCLRGMLLDDILGRDKEFFDRHVEMLIVIVSPYIKARNVSEPPPKLEEFYIEGQ
ncbi:MAG: TetR/AcrR family transcriptional regulator [Pseudomonadota bacterium]